MRNLWAVFLCLTFIGCAAAHTNKYAGIYNDAVAAGKSAVIIKEGDFDTMKAGVEQQLNSLGYNKILYSSPTEPFMVLVKGIDYGNPLLNGDAQAHKIFLKYTKLSAGSTRIDLVNGAVTASTKDDVDMDIQKLAELIKNN